MKSRMEARTSPAQAMSSISSCALHAQVRVLPTSRYYCRLLTQRGCDARTFQSLSHLARDDGTDKRHTPFKSSQQPNLFASSEALFFRDGERCCRRRSLYLRTARRVPCRVGRSCSCVRILLKIGCLSSKTLQILLVRHPAHAWPPRGLNPSLPPCKRVTLASLSPNQLQGCSSNRLSRPL